MDKERNISTLTVVGGTFCCDFINTVYAWQGTNLHEYLGCYADFIAWCRKVNVGNGAVLTQLDQKGIQEPEAAEAALRQIKKIRLLLYTFISAIAAKDFTEVTKLLPSINALLHKASGHLLLYLDNDDFLLSPQEEPDNLLSPLWMVVKSLQDMLLTTDRNRIKECPRCGWVFADTTKNGKRRWCEPEECGTADKMQRYHAKKKAAENKESKPPAAE